MSEISCLFFNRLEAVYEFVLASVGFSVAVLERHVQPVLVV
jgi:hypothetical protein